MGGLIITKNKLFKVSIELLFPIDFERAFWATEMHILNEFGNKAEGLGGQLTFKLIYHIMTHVYEKKNWMGTSIVEQMRHALTKYSSV